jgi:hypothetical protein
MAIECPDCRTVTGNDDSEQCVACGRFLYKVKRRSNSDVKLISISLVIGMLLTFFVVQRHC